jgi:hypothetical protein
MNIFQVLWGVAWIVIGGIAGVSWIAFCFGSVLGVILILLINPSLLFLPFGLCVYGLAILSQGLGATSGSQKIKSYDYRVADEARSPPVVLQESAQDNCPECGGSNVKPASTSGGSSQKPGYIPYCLDCRKFLMPLNKK